MQNKRTAFIFAALLVLAGSAFAAATLEVSDYSVLPEKIYPGSVGYLRLTLTNSGNQEAQSVSVAYGDSGSQLSVGTIAADSSVTVSVPFSIPETSDGRIFPVTAQVYYSEPVTGGSTIAKRTSLSIPVEVSQFDAIQVTVLSSDKSSISQGDKITFRLLLANAGGVANSVQISTPENSSFSIDGQSVQSAGNIASGSQAEVNLSLRSSSSTQTGSYNIPITVAYRDSQNRPIEQSLFIGPVNVLGSSMQYRLEMASNEPVEIGSQAVLPLRLTNTGTEPVSAVVDVGATDVFTPIGFARVYFDSVQPGQSMTREVVVGVSPSQSSGYYTLPVTLTPNRGQASEFSIGILVSATPDLEISTEQSTSGGTRILVANGGNSAVRSVSLVATDSAGREVAKGFIGTLNIDDSAGVDLSAGASYPVLARVTFKDSTNKEITVQQELSSASASGLAVANGASANGTRSTTIRGPGGVMFGGTGASAGIGQLLLAGGAIVALVAAFLAYRWWKGKNKGHDAAQKK